MSQFKVGDVCIGQNHVEATHRNGMECTVIDELRYMFWRTVDGRIEGGEVYVVEWADGKICASWPKKLRKKQPPHREIDQTVSWEECGWKPIKEAA